MACFVLSQFLRAGENAPQGHICIFAGHGPLEGCPQRPQEPAAATVFKIKTMLCGLMDNPHPVSVVGTPRSSAFIHVLAATAARSIYQFIRISSAGLPFSLFQKPSFFSFLHPDQPLELLGLSQSSAFYFRKPPLCRRTVHPIASSSPCGPHTCARFLA